MARIRARAHTCQTGRANVLIGVTFYLARRPFATTGCAQPTSPVDKSNLGCTSCNYQDGKEVAVTVTADECLDPQKTTLATGGAQFLWGTSLTQDNRMLFRYVAKAGAATKATTTAPAGGAGSLKPPSVASTVGGACTLLSGLFLV